MQTTSLLIVVAGLLMFTACQNSVTTDLSPEFKRASKYRIGHSTYAVDAEDLNGDQNLDLAVADYNLGMVLIMLGNGDGTFTLLAPVELKGKHTDIEILDANQDGRMDLIVEMEHDGTRVLLGNGKGTFVLDTEKRELQPFSDRLGDGFLHGTLADINGDGQPDRIEVFSIEEFGLSLRNILALIDDLRGAGRIKVSVGDRKGNFKGTGSYRVGHWPKKIAVADFNGDNLVDIATADYRSDSVTILVGHGDGSFSNRVILKAGDRPSDIVSGDFNRDGRNDLAVSHWGDGSVEIYLNQGNR